MAIWALPNVVEIREDKSIRSREIRASDLWRSKHERSGRRAEVSNRKNRPCLLNSTAKQMETHKIWQAVTALQEYKKKDKYSLCPILTPQKSYMGAEQHVSAVISWHILYQTASVLHSQNITRVFYVCSDRYWRFLFVSLKCDKYSFFKIKHTSSFLCFN